MNATIDKHPNSDNLIFTGAYLHYETVESTYHVESQREQRHLANRKQIVTLLQSEIVRLDVEQRSFATTSGNKLTVANVQARFKSNPLALMLPDGATIYPQLALALNPDTVTVSRVDRRSKPLRLVPRPDGG
ncbi:hypothetical protein [Rosistilla ulvae]|uniref:hypothetical protein n=1 Tax=Rosistilla ulvae TaxID=1930277 RepID=UPI0011A449E6|nr:hypothetical protein [Rosistilla ulvae]